MPAALLSSSLREIRLPRKCLFLKGPSTKFSTLRRSMQQNNCAENNQPFFIDSAEKCWGNPLIVNSIALRYVHNIKSLTLTRFSDGDAS